VSPSLSEKSDINPVDNGATGAMLALGAAALFGSAAPFAKLLLSEASPLMLSAMLYLGAAIALNLWAALSSPVEAGLSRRDIWPMMAIIALGGMAGPYLMMAGLRHVSAVTGSLLLNLEAPFTIMIAVALFREHLGTRAAIAAALIITGAMIAGAGRGAIAGDWRGVAGLAGACMAWACDNNLSQRLSLRNPIAIARIKTLGAGLSMLIIALAAGMRPPHLRGAAAALGLGAISYGVSLVLALKAMRLLGAAREAAYFATAPFMGALIAIPLFAELPSRMNWIAAGVMAAGVIAMASERHRHAHQHDAIEHEHFHAHNDEHHRHPHAGPAAAAHSHWHRHERIVHTHEHQPDLHHRHEHS
jgi:drug/metabolite transporter (DMT)-like permease